MKKGRQDRIAETLTGNEVFHTEKRIVSSLETILETNRYW